VLYRVPYGSEVGPRIGKTEGKGGRQAGGSMRETPGRWLRRTTSKEAREHEDLVRHGAHLDVPRKEADERAAVQRVDEPYLLRRLGHRVLAERHVETCVYDHTGAGQLSRVCGAGTAAGLARAAAQHAGFTQRMRDNAARPPFSAVVDPPKGASAACQPGRSSVAAVPAAVDASR